MGRTLEDISPKNLCRRVNGKNILVTGATSGIGHEVAIKLANAGAEVILVARTPEKLQSTVDEITAAGGSATCYACDLSDTESCDALIRDVLADFGKVDILVNNAGRSIRRSVTHSYDRFHDFERTMQLNYFGSLKLIMGFLPGMVEAGGGHVINISSIGVLTSPPRFSAYVASKSALDAFSWCAAAEFAHRGIHFTTINMPLVATPMIAPTTLYKAFPTLTPDEAANLVCKAVTERPKRVATGLGLSGAVAQALVPKASELVLNQAYHLFPDSVASQGEGGDSEDIPNGAFDIAGRVFAQLLRGNYW
ncbi:Fatty acyl-CoA reductase [BD1-7 clade bacterium]|uniref:Fatty acyl-CoA reductase n=1 Tax=BD1-7 clade bacterium TaxID=2029982 RepID=A0A5S9QQ28_9GAMM|nr:Fatty acyl-CoA reductase [BD1-7 clade bacterium]CAA0122360.1 Fatty acyl-CoA reductase [BD1-7 clade bacterium]